MRNTAVDFLFRTVALVPDSVAVSDESGSLTFRELFANACALSERLADAGSRNQPILVYLPKSVSAIVSFAAVLLSGNCYVPIDIRSPYERKMKIIADLGPAKVITRRDYESEIRGLFPDMDKVVFLEDAPPGNEDTSVPRLLDRCAAITDRIIDADPCYIMYTSGSTGVPKGVVIPHRGVVDYSEWAKGVFPLAADVVIGNQSPLFFDNSTLDIYLSWATGALLHLIPEKLFMFPIRLVEHMERQKVSFIFFVPSVLVSLARKNVLTAGRMPDLKIVAFAGEVMPTKHLATWQSIFPDKMYVNLYGPTEITVDCTYFIVDRVYGPDEALPIGYPCLNSGVLILDENGRHVPPGEKGELCVRGSSLALGYWNDPEKTRAAFTQNPTITNYRDLIYRTGDIVVQHKDRPIRFVGRKDSQIKHQGYRIELGEIESAAGSLSYITACCVVYDQEKREIALYYEAEEDYSEARLINDLSEKIPSYMMPKKFRRLSSMPLNQNGKIDRKFLAEKLGLQMGRSDFEHLKD